MPRSEERGFSLLTSSMHSEKTETTLYWMGKLGGPTQYRGQIDLLSHPN